MRRTAIALALLIVPVLALSGCTPTPPPAVTAPKPSSTPLFATEDEALKAATEAYAAYLKVSDQITSEGGANPERIAPLVTPSQLKRDLQTFHTYQAKGYFSRGVTGFSRLRIQSYSALSNSNEVVAYVCADFTNIRLTDSRGVDITPTDLESVSPLEVRFASARSAPPKLLLDRSEQWTGKDFCS